MIKFQLSGSGRPFIPVRRARMGQSRRSEAMCQTAACVTDPIFLVCRPPRHDATEPIADSQLWDHGKL